MNLDNDHYQVDNLIVGYSDFDMKMMALGEIAAQIIGLVASVFSWLLLEGLSVALKIPVALVVLLVVVKLLFVFVHLGYTPDVQRDES